MGTFPRLASYFFLALLKEDREIFWSCKSISFCSIPFGKLRILKSTDSSFHLPASRSSSCYALSVKDFFIEIDLISPKNKAKIKF